MKTLLTSPLKTVFMLPLFAAAFVLLPGVASGYFTEAGIDDAGLMAPAASDTSIIVANNQDYIFQTSDFSFAAGATSVENITIESVTSSRVRLNGTPVSVGDAISIQDIEDGLFSYVPDSGTYGFEIDDFTFTVTSLGGITGPETYTYGISTGASSVTFGLAADEQVRGWRFFASPAQNETFGGLVGNLFTQGFTGAKFENGMSNIYTFDSANNAWQSISDINDPVERGEGFLMFVYEQDDNRDAATPPQWPKVLTPSDLVFSNDPDFEYDLFFDFDQFAGGRTAFFSMIGNPKPFGFNFCFTDRNNVESTIRVWNPSANMDSEGNIFGAFEEKSCVQQSNIVKVAPYQSFLVNALFRNPRIQFDPFSYVGEPVEGLFGSEPEFAYVHDLFTIEMESVEGSFSNSVTFVITDEAAPKPAEHDAVKLSSEGFTSKYLSLFTTDKDRKTPYAIRHVIPSEIPVNMPLDFETTQSGEFDLRWEFPSQLESERYSIVLRDLKNGTEVDMSQAQSYRFSYVSEKAGLQQIDAQAWEAAPLATPDVRYDDLPFEIVFVMNEPTSTGGDNELPRTAVLKQNYPNPFNPTTQISFELPQATDVSLDVYNINGQRIMTLVKGSMSAGQHQVTFDGSELSSGIYLYQLRTGDVVQTRKMMLLK